MGEVVDLPGARSRWFADARGRSLRATWHPESGLIVLSLWNADDCVGTFRLSLADAAQLGALIAQANPEFGEHASDGYGSSTAIGP
jgi:hypothetical protein